LSTSGGKSQTHVSRIHMPMSSADFGKSGRYDKGPGRVQTCCMAQDR